MTVKSSKASQWLVRVRDHKGQSTGQRCLEEDTRTLLC